MLEKLGKEIPIGPHAVIGCPLKGFKPRRAARSCPECVYYNGLGRMGVEGDWSAQYAILCAHPIERRTQHIEVIES
ncbi:MAG: hypothetical protein IIB69_14760 [Proteobacteria bacterium]|nr:hypothetical protein [Pseudomonadota bacterium]